MQRDAPRRRRRESDRLVAALLSMVAPGAGQLYAGARRRGALLLAAFATACVGLVALAARPLDAAGWLFDRRLVATLLAANAVVLILRLFAVVDAWRPRGAAASRLAVGGLAVLAALTIAPHVAAGYLTARGHDVLANVFAAHEPRDAVRSDRVVLSAPPRRIARERPPLQVDLTPLRGSRRILVGDRRAFERPWVTMMLIGTDAGPGNWGARTDTMVLAALERGTGRALLFGVPRNLVEVPLTGVAAERGLRRFREPLNALYGFAKTRPALFPGGRDAGATALKQTVSALLGVRVDYYALVDLDGFRDVVDALGGVDIHITERLVDEVTRPAWGETKPRIDVHPGRTYHFDGRTALAYVRTRKDSNDYRRMARQRCFLSAMAAQMDIVHVLANFRTLAATVEESVETDIPLSRMPELLDLVSRVQPRRTRTVSFGPEYIARRRKSDRYPLPNVRKMRAAARAAILDPDAPKAGNVESPRAGC